MDSTLATPTGEQAAAPLGVLAAEPSFVILTTLDGRKLNGRVAAFHPEAAELTVLPEPLDLDQQHPYSVRTDELAYVAFCGPADPPGQSERWRVHVVGGEEWRVYASLQAVSSPVGFFGQPVGDDGVRRIYFFRHGVNARERDTPLGAILVSAGVLPQATVSQAVVSQEKGRGVAIGQILVEQKKIDAITVDEAAELQKRKQVRIGEVLQEAGLLSAQDIEQALQEQRRRKRRRFGEVLVELKLLSERDLTATLAMKFALPFVSLQTLTPKPDAVALVPRELMHQYGVMPIDVDTRVVTVAISDPTSVEAIEALRAATKRHVRELVVMPSELQQYLNKHFPLATPHPAREGSHPPSAGSRSTSADAFKRTNVPTDDGIGRLLTQVLTDAHRRGVHEVHLESNGKDQSVAVRFRIGKSCPVQTTLPPIVRNALVTRIKSLAQLDVDERKLPQSGLGRWQIEDKTLNLRVIVLPTVFGDEDVVLHVRAQIRAIPLEGIGFGPEALRDVKHVLGERRGMIICAGPSFSGKTTLLHALLSCAGPHDAKLYSAEHPVELCHASVRQIQVQPERGFGFAQAARALLKADPDVFMLGEIDQSETATLAAEGALRGHMVLGGMVANSAVEVVTRLWCHGIHGAALASILSAVVSCRVVPALCRYCSVRERAALSDYEELVQAYGPDQFARDVGIASAEKLELPRAHGCAECSQTGYRGLVGVQEVFIMTPELRSALSANPTPESIALAASQAGCQSLAQSAMRKVLAGQIDLAQALSIAGS